MAALISSPGLSGHPRILPRSRFRAAAVHLLASALVAGLVAVLIFRLWYPAPFDTIAGGASLFVLLVSVDVVLGPALTLVAASPSKPSREFRRDLAVIIALQIAAFGYGVSTIAVARPVFISFEIDRFRVVTAGDVESDQLVAAPPELRSMPWWGPELIAAVKPTDPGEQLKSIELGLAGFDLSMIPKNWRSYASQRDAVWKAARPIAILASKYPAKELEVASQARTAGLPVSSLRFLPVMSRRASWVAVLGPPGARIVGYLPVEGFF